jgi:hypothetical protein
MEKLTRERVVPTISLRGSPKKSPLFRMPIVASFPICDTTVIFTFPSLPLGEPLYRSFAGLSKNPDFTH